MSDGLDLDFFHKSAVTSTDPGHENALWKASELVDGLLDVLITGANLGYYSSFPKVIDLNVA
jgi:hypothetical protein